MHEWILVVKGCSLGLESYILNNFDGNGEHFMSDSRMSLGNFFFLGLLKINDVVFEYVVVDFNKKKKKRKDQKVIL